MQVSELEGDVLDLWVAKCERLTPIPGQPLGFFYWADGSSGWYNPSTNWELGGPVMEKAALGWRARGITSHVGIHKGFSSVEGQPWEAWFCDEGSDGGNPFIDRVQVGPTILVAVMRARVASVYGAEVPDAGPDFTL
jgi:hypothetical protein